MELSGRVVAVGRAGDAAGSSATRSWASSAAAPTPSGSRCTSASSWPCPTSVGVADAAAIPEVWITAFDALVAQGGLTSGRTALVHAGGSGVGTAAIQIAKAIGARVIVTASAGKVDRCLALGADRRRRLRGRRLRRRDPRAHRRRGRRRVLDVIGGDYVERNIDAVAVRGRIIQVGVMGGGAVTGEHRQAAAQAGQRSSAPCCGPGRSRRRSPSPGGSRPRCCRCSTPGGSHPVIDRRFPLDDIADAHARHGGQRERRQDPHRRRARLTRARRYRTSSGRDTRRARSRGGSAAATQSSSSGVKDTSSPLAADAALRRAAARRGRRGRCGRARWRRSSSRFS